MYFCPTGAFAQLPLHAAGNFDGDNNSNLSAYAVASYIPTLGALINARRQFRLSLKNELRALLVSVPSPQAHSWIPFAEHELNIVRSFLPHGTEIMLPEGDTLTTCQNVLDRLRDASVLHLACHGHQSLDNPLDSGFVMNDGMLTVPMLMSLRLPSAVFAFLSACETAKGDGERPDQAIHLAAAMLFAGFKSIIGTMWRVVNFYVHRRRCPYLSTQVHGRRRRAIGGEDRVQGAVQRRFTSA
jgi:CHAT domain-containing protein